MEDPIESMQATKIPDCCTEMAGVRLPSLHQLNDDVLRLVFDQVSEPAPRHVSHGGGLSDGEVTAARSIPFIASISQSGLSTLQ